MLLHLQDQLFSVSFLCLFVQLLLRHIILDGRIISFRSCLFDLILGERGAGEEDSVVPALSLVESRLSRHAKPGGTDRSTDHQTFSAVEGTMIACCPHKDSAFPTDVYRRMYGNSAVTVSV